MAPARTPPTARARKDAAMGIRMLHRRTAHARVHATATTDTRVDPDAGPAPRPLPALAPGAATPRVPRTPVTALRAALRRLRDRVLDRLDRLTRLVHRFRDGAWRPWCETARGCLALALGTLGRLRGRRRARRISLFVVPPPAPLPLRLVPPLTEHPDGSAPRR
ncbi:hypothetical protein JCM4814A_60090 [Streptomyces phaeofaciens JCM 4814]